MLPPEYYVVAHAWRGGRLHYVVWDGPLYLVWAWASAKAAAECMPRRRFIVARLSSIDRPEVEWRAGEEPDPWRVIKIGTAIPRGAWLPELGCAYESYLGYKT